MSAGAAADPNEPTADELQHRVTRAFQRADRRAEQLGAHTAGVPWGETAFVEESGRQQLADEGAAATGRAFLERSPLADRLEGLLAEPWDQGPTREDLMQDIGSHLAFLDLPSVNDLITRGVETELRMRVVGLTKFVAEKTDEARVTEAVRRAGLGLTGPSATEREMAHALDSIRAIVARDTPPPGVGRRAAENQRTTRRHEDEATQEPERGHGLGG